jgi:membrane protease YdiL (CAAX protease family)
VNAAVRQPDAASDDAIPAGADGVEARRDLDDAGGADTGAWRAGEHGQDATAPEPRVAPRDRIASTIEVLLCSGFPTQLVVTVALAAAGMPVGFTIRYIVWLSVIDTVLVVGLVLLFLRSRGERPSRVLLGNRPIRRETGLGIALVPVAFVLIVTAAQLIEWLAPGLRNPAGNPLAELLEHPVDIALFAVVAVVAGGFREEIQRAFVLHRFEQHLGGAPLGLALFSVAFGLGHAMQGWDAAIMTGLLGAFWGFVYLWRRTIAAAVVCHALFNLVEVLSHGLFA